MLVRKGETSMNCAIVQNKCSPGRSGTKAEKWSFGLSRMYRKDQEQGQGEKEDFIVTSESSKPNKQRPPDR